MGSGFLLKMGEGKKGGESMKKEYQWAKRYLEIGWSIFPVREDKTPAVPTWTIYRTKKATDEELRSWFENTNYGIALVCGKLSGIAVLDDDNLKKTGVPSDLVKNIRSSVVSQTAGGGRHYFIKYEEGFSNQINIRGKNVDLKTEGGYVIIPPSKRAGKEYVWISPPTKENLAKLPRLSYTPEVVGKKNYHDFKLDQYLFVGKGQRNDALFRLARSLFNRLSKQQVIDFIYSANAQYKPPLDKREVDTILNQAYKYYLIDTKQPMLPAKTMDEIKIERLIEREFEKIAPTTGFPTLDKLISGFVPGRLYTLTAETNYGKTTLSCNFAVNVAKQNRKVLYIALESGNSILDTLTSIYFEKPYSQITDEDLDRFAKQEKNITAFVDRDISKMYELVNVIKNAQERYDLVIIDHIGYFVSSDKNYLQEQANVLKELRFLTKEKKLAILVIAHLRKRGKDEKKNKMPSMDDISGSAAFKQDSTDVLILTREKDQTDDKNIKLTKYGFLYVMKTKATKGGLGVVDLVFNDTEVENKSAFIRERTELDL